MTIQPVTIAYTHLRGDQVMPRSLRSLYAWYGDMTLLPHLWTLLGLPGVGVAMHFHAPVPAAGFASRKALARHAQGEVARGLEAARTALGPPRETSATLAPGLDRPDPESWAAASRV